MTNKALEAFKRIETSLRSHLQGIWHSTCKAEDDFNLVRAALTEAPKVDVEQVLVEHFKKYMYEIPSQSFVVNGVYTKSEDGETKFIGKTILNESMKEAIKDFTTHYDLVKKEG